MRSLPALPRLRLESRLIAPYTPVEHHRLNRTTRQAIRSTLERASLTPRRIPRPGSESTKRLTAGIHGRILKRIQTCPPARALTAMRSLGPEASEQLLHTAGRLSMDAQSHRSLLIVTTRVSFMSAPLVRCAGLAPS